MHSSPLRAPIASLALLGALVATAATTAGAHPSHAVTAARAQETIMVSVAKGGGTPNGASTNPVMSNDKRYVRAIAFQSDASNLGPRDGNGTTDVYATLRGNSANNTGTKWRPGKNILISRTRSGAAGNGPSTLPTVDGSFHSSPTCVGFLSEASNLVAGDTNGQADAFFKKIRSGAVRRLRPSGGQPKQPATAVAVSGNCKLIAFVQGGKLYVSKGGARAKRIKTRANPADPSFSTGLRNDLVFGAKGGVYLLKNGRGRPQLVGRGGRNPVYNDIKRRTVAYEKQRGGHWQIAYHDIGKRERIISSFHGDVGNGDSRNPVIGNSGYYVTFETDASNLQTSASGRRLDDNGQPDVYLYTDTRKITLLESQSNADEALPGGAKDPAMSFYANYILFDSPAGTRSGDGNRQIFLRWLGSL